MEHKISEDQNKKLNEDTIILAKEIVRLIVTYAQLSDYSLIYLINLRMNSLLTALDIILDWGISLTDQKIKKIHNICKFRKSVIDSIEAKCENIIESIMSENDNNFHENVH